MSGEETAPYQPDPELPEPIERMEFLPEEITDRTPQAHDFEVKRLAGARLGFFVPAESGSLQRGKNLTAFPPLLTVCLPTHCRVEQPGSSSGS